MTTLTRSSLLLALTIASAATALAGRGPEVRYANQPTQETAIQQASSSETQSPKTTHTIVRNKGGRNSGVTLESVSKTEKTQVTARWKPRTHR